MASTASEDHPGAARPATPGGHRTTSSRAAPAVLEPPGPAGPGHGRLVTGGTFVSVTGAVRGRSDTPATSWSVPYVDVTLTPTFQFQDPEANPARTRGPGLRGRRPRGRLHAELGRRYYSLDEAAADLELDRRIAQLRSAGGDVMVSFGGLANDELAVACTDSRRPHRAPTATSSSATTCPPSTSTSRAPPSPTRPPPAGGPRPSPRCSASGRPTARPLAVWLTLPVAPSGLTGEAVDLVRTTLAGGVELTGVNVMTMDYGNARPVTQSMQAATEQALRATAAQVGRPLRGARARRSATPRPGPASARRR